jgi:DNA-binding NarL/FixJ family response regulator
MTPTRRPRMLIVGDSTAMRGAIRDFVEATTPYKVCDEVDDGVPAIEKATEFCCDLILLYLGTPLRDNVTVSLLRGKLPRVKIVGFSTLSADVEEHASPATGFDAVLTKQDGLSNLVATLKALMPAEPRE